MGAFLEALWGYYINQALQGEEGEVAAACEIGWLASHEYNDFACIRRDEVWDPTNKTGELLRIEAKSMNAGAEESKAHFDELFEKLGEWDLLLVLVWGWQTADDNIRVYPQILDHFIGPARSIAALRDHLHIARNGSFVNRAVCPDGCDQDLCTHHGEPLNANGKRERISGPYSRRPSDKVSYASNFGGLVRMLKTESQEARQTFRTIRHTEAIAHEYISFIHRNFLKEEANQYQLTEWKELAHRLHISTQGLSKDQLIEKIRQTVPDNYRQQLRHIHIATNQQLELF